MSILLEENSRIVVQGITGRTGLFHTALMMEYGSKVVSGVAPSKGGEWVLDGKIPVFDSVKSAVQITEADTSVLFIPPKNTPDAIIEAAEAGIQLIFCITDQIPLQEMMKICAFLKTKNCTLIGPGSAGIISPRIGKVGVIPGDIAIAGNIGIVTSANSLVYEMLHIFSNNHLGISSCVDVGQAVIKCTGYQHILQLFEDDPYTDKIVIAGDLLHDNTRMISEFVSTTLTKPVYGLFTGSTLSLKDGSHRMVESKNKLMEMESSGIKLFKSPPELVKELRK
ncbi:MAG: succinate--CoA ligase subunit alpha [Anaerolineales bacterium]|nr:succinate--CoA ligase subunit alpha [Anaerolineales bacterium]